MMESLTRLRVRESERGDRPVVEAEPLLEVEDLRVAFPAAHGDIDIVDGASFRVRPGETMGLVGESGSGKSVTALAMMGDRKSTRLNSSHVAISYAVFCLKKKNQV